MNNRNYQRELDKIIDNLCARQVNGQDSPATKHVPRLFLHSCCAPCSSYVLEYLRQYFRITVFYYNPNITEQEEYRKRVQEEIRLIEAYNRQAQEQRKGREGQRFESTTHQGLDDYIKTLSQRVKNLEVTS